MNACKDCCFLDDSWGNCCRHPYVMKPDPVHGAVMESCHSARAEGGRCGPDALYFHRYRGLFERLFGRALALSSQESP